LEESELHFRRRKMDDKGGRLALEAFDVAFA
jgi:hypothetical protein